MSLARAVISALTSKAMFLDAGSGVACSHTLVFDYQLVNSTSLVSFQLHACQQTLSLNANETYCILPEYCTALRLHALFCRFPVGLIICA